LTLGLGILAVGGCGSRASSRVLPIPVPADAAQNAIAMYDTDKNGYLDAAELEKVPSLKFAFVGANKVTAEDIAARFEEWQRTRFGRMSFLVRVTRKGQPVPDATVTLVPESFLGPAFQTATGQTDRMGSAMMSGPVAGPEDAPGVSPGFYRLQITKPGEKIPAKYNTETVFGLEVPTMQEGRFKFDMVY
jgi:hypothetical protein